MSNFKLDNLNFGQTTSEEVITCTRRKEKLFKTFGNYKPKAQIRAPHKHNQPIQAQPLKFPITKIYQNHPKPTNPYRNKNTTHY